MNAQQLINELLMLVADRRAEDIEVVTTMYSDSPEPIRSARLVQSVKDGEKIEIEVL